ncbi:hypothetical protein [Alicyclobacillus sp. ALC3]|uniref:hypothetical protein n=1 Tax=Alicyclobacillus sp. ALC3 TaxID=2796143 RepID=UPI002379EBE0|nr:hypothetical protein [Alicyclobacillus sp. ALC3]WDL97789.1 hypothetical protein JC200_03400 [Alicyclobacillus sp. ALC3]
MLNKTMHRFSVWFASPAGVLQTFALTLLWVIVEHIWPLIDPNGFILLYVLTVYSGITQPVLAYASSVSAAESGLAQQKLEAMQRQMVDVQNTQTQMLENHVSMMRTILAIAQDIREDVEDIVEMTAPDGSVLVTLEPLEARNARSAAVPHKGDDR